MRIVIAAVGRLKQGPERELAADYRKRAESVGRAFGLRDVEIVEIRESRAGDAERRRTEESIAIANVIPEGAIIVILDEHGIALGSAALAASLREWRADNRPAVCFVIGGADGEGAGPAAFWARAARLAPSGSANASAEPSTKRGSMRFARRRIMTFKGRPRPQEGKE